MRTMFVMAGLLACTAAGGSAQTAAPTSAPDATVQRVAIFDRLINQPLPDAVQIVGAAARAPSKVRADKTVQGGRALRVTIPAKGAQPWAVSAVNPTIKPVKAGDTLMLAFWARLEKGEGGATTAELPNNTVQITAPPYQSLFGKPATIGPEWKIYEARGKVERDFAAGELAVSIHLATGKHVVDLGPVYLFNLSAKR